MSQWDAYVSGGLAIGGYVGGRIIEQALFWLWHYARGNFHFEQNLEGDIARLSLRSRSTIFLDELTIYLQDRQIDVLSLVRASLKMTGERVQLSPADRIVLEFIVQQYGDKKMFVHSYIGSAQGISETDLATTQSTVTGFVYETRIVAETSERHYERTLFRGLP
jgi:hypothetical protein